MKKIMALILALTVAAACLGGCGSDKASSDANGSKSTASQEKKTDDEAAAKKKAAQKKAEEKKAEAKKAESETASSGSDTNASSGVKKSSSTSSDSESKKSGATATKKKCTISVNASEILGSSASSDVKNLVPSGGYLISKRTLQIESGDTVKDVLLRTAKSAGVAVSVQGGNYVDGIGGIFEKDAGSKSGWMYSVNGEFVQVACSDKTVKKGDVIAWEYTLEVGKDL